MPVAANVSVGRVSPSKSGDWWSYGFLAPKEITKTLTLGQEAVGDANGVGHRHRG